MGKRRGKKRAIRQGVQQHRNAQDKKPDPRENKDRVDDASKARVVTDKPVQAPHAASEQEEPTNQASAPQKQTSDQTIVRWTKILGWSTVVLAGATILSAVVLFFTELTLRHQVEVTQGQLREMQIARQPFVYFEDLKFEFDPNSSPNTVRLYAYPLWKNSGDSSTSRLTTSVFCDLKSDEFDYRKVGTIPRLLGPKQTKGGGRCEMSITPIPSIAGPIGWAHIGGKARYFGSADDTTVRISEFCQIIPLVRVPTADGFTIRAGMDGAMFCDNGHNCADAECPAEDRQ